MATKKQPRTNRGDPHDSNRKWDRVVIAGTIRKAEAKAGRILTPAERAEIGRGRAYRQSSNNFSTAEMKRMNQYGKEIVRARQGRINLTKVPSALPARSGPSALPARSGPSAGGVSSLYNRLTGGGMNKPTK